MYNIKYACIDIETLNIRRGMLFTLLGTLHTTLWLENHDSHKTKEKGCLSMKIEALIVDVKGEEGRDHGIGMETQDATVWVSRMRCRNNYLKLGLSATHVF